MMSDSSDEMAFPQNTPQRPTMTSPDGKGMTTTPQEAVATPERSPLKVQKNAMKKSPVKKTSQTPMKKSPTPMKSLTPMKQSPTPMKQSPTPMKQSPGAVMDCASPQRPKALFSPEKAGLETPQKKGSAMKSAAPMKSSLSGKKTAGAPRMARGTAGTFAGRRPPQDKDKLVLFELIKDSFNTDREKDKLDHAETARAKATPQEFWKYIMHQKKVTTIKEFKAAYADWCKEMQ